MSGPLKGPPVAESSGAAASGAETNALLKELRELARVLPNGLDEIALAESIVRQTSQKLSATAVVLFQAESGSPVCQLAAIGTFGDSDDFTGLLAGVAVGQTTVNRTERPVGFALIVPLSVDGEVVGILVCWRTQPDWDSDEIQAAAELAADAAPHLDSAQLFREVRAIATVEERHRLAREIHDGIAQEVASLGYTVDDLIAGADSPKQREGLAQLRSELSRIVTELRLSIFDLRSDIGANAGLAAALSGYVRQVGATSDLTIHLVLAESAQRLPQAMEIELLRIAQEAITNVRRHADASNLWVTCRTDPPHAYLRVADDGVGRRDGRTDSYGLDIMAERAERAGVELTIRDRRGGGTIVEIKTQPGIAELSEQFVKGSTVRPQSDNVSSEGGQNP